MWRWTTKVYITCNLPVSIFTSDIIVFLSIQRHYSPIFFFRYHHTGMTNCVYALREALSLVVEEVIVCQGLLTPSIFRAVCVSSTVRKRILKKCHIGTGRVFWLNFRVWKISLQDIKRVRNFCGMVSRKWDLHYLFGTRWKKYFSLLELLWESMYSQ